MTRSKQETFFRLHVKFSMNLDFEKARPFFCQSAICKNPRKNSWWWVSSSLPSLTALFHFFKRMEIKEDRLGFSSNIDEDSCLKNFWSRWGNRYVAIEELQLPMTWWVFDGNGYWTQLMFLSHLVAKTPTTALPSLESDTRPEMVFLSQCSKLYSLCQVKQNSFWKPKTNIFHNEAFPFQLCLRSCHADNTRLISQVKKCWVCLIVGLEIAMKITFSFGPLTWWLNLKETDMALHFLTHSSIAYF